MLELAKAVFLYLFCHAEPLVSCINIWQNWPED